MHSRKSSCCCNTVASREIKNETKRKNREQEQQSTLKIHKGMVNSGNEGRPIIDVELLSVGSKRDAGFSHLHFMNTFAKGEQVFRENTI